MERKIVLPPRAAATGVAARIESVTRISATQLRTAPPAPRSANIELTADDLARRAVIQALACHFELAKESIEIAHLVEFDRYFAAEMKDLEKLERDGLVELDSDWIHVTPRGRLLVRCVCMVFDKYLRAAEQRAQYSRVM